MYPRIENIKDILPYVENKKNIVIKDNGNGTTSINYTTITDSKLFNCHYTRECRGITFDNKTGNIVIRPFQKFFNIGEKPETMPDKLDWNDVKSITEKIDGSICTTMVIDGAVVAKSMSSFDSIHAKRMTEYINKNWNLVYFCKTSFESGLTPIFEYVAPKFQIVIPYEKEEITLLAIRNMVNGEYINLDLTLPLRSLALDSLNINLLNNYNRLLNGDYSLLQETLQKAKDTEGYVITFNNGQMVKAKTLWYTQLHRCKAMLSEKNVAEACLTGDIDDIKGMMTTMGLDVTRANEIDIMVSRGLIHLTEQTEKLYNLYDYEYDKNGNRCPKSRKNFALDWKNEKCFPLVMRKIDGKDIDYMEFYKKRILPVKFGKESVIV
jgi:RNA ligase